MSKLEIYKKKLLYRSNYRGTKEMDILLSSFVKKYIDILSEPELKELEKFLEFEDETLFNFYYKGTIEKKLDKNIISKKFRDFKF